MKQTISVALLFWVVIIMILQPIFSYRDYLIEGIVKANANHLAQKAAVEGYVSESLKQEIIENLEKIGFIEDEVLITYDSVQVERGTRIDVKVQAPRPPSFPYLFTSEPVENIYYARANIMSEYLD